VFWSFAYTVLRCTFQFLLLVARRERSKPGSVDERCWLSGV
jgi:hypothetical protein